MPPNRKITATEITAREFFELQDELDTGILGPIKTLSIPGGVAYASDESGTVLLKVINNVRYATVGLKTLIKAAKKLKE